MTSGSRDPQIAFTTSAFRQYAVSPTMTEGTPGAGLWLSRDHGKTSRASDELPFSNIQRVGFAPSNDGVIHMTTFGGSVWRGPATPSE